MALWTALPRFRGDSSERTWVYRVAHNTALSFAASRRRRDGREQPGESEREPATAAPQEGDAIENSIESVSGPQCRNWRSPSGRSSCCISRACLPQRSKLLPA